MIVVILKDFVLNTYRLNLADDMVILADLGINFQSIPVAK